MESETTRLPPMHCWLYVQQTIDAGDDAVETVATLLADAALRKKTGNAKCNAL
jgi:hypothetical protein